jgi:hypothetical protein
MRFMIYHLPFPGWLAVADAPAARQFRVWGQSARYALPSPFTVHHSCVVLALALLLDMSSKNWMR